MSAKGKSTKKPDQENIIKMIYAKRGNITEVARAFGVVRRTVEYWLAKSQKLKDAQRDAIESLVDYAETQAFVRITGIPKYKTDPTTGKKEQIGWLVEPSDKLIELILTTKGKDRGYVRKQEVEIDGNIIIDFSDENN